MNSSRHRTTAGQAPGASTAREASGPARSWGKPLAFLLSSVWVLACMTAAGWPYHAGIWGYVWPLAAGFAAWLVAVRVTHVLLKDVDTGFLIGFVGLLQVFVFAAILIHCLPPFRVGLSLSDTAQPMDLAALGHRRPDLPAYVTLAGHPQPAFTVRDVYQPPRTKQNRNPRAVVIDYTPLAPPDWDHPQPITVLIDTAAFRVRDEEAVLTGVLLPFAPGPDEPGLLVNPLLFAGAGGMGFGIDWLRQRANFRFDPRRLYLLRENSPDQLRMPTYIILTLLGIYLAGVTWCLRPRAE